MADLGTSFQRVGGSALAVMSGLSVLGVSALVYLVLAARATGPLTFGSLAVLWTLVYTVGIGLFVPFEQELARAVSSRAARRQGLGHVVRRACTAAAGLLLVLVMVVLATLPWTWATIFDESAAILGGLVLACTGLAAQFVQRGLFSGTGRFDAYAIQIAVEGAVRLIGTVALVAAGVSSPAPYALLLGLAPLVSVFAVGRAFLSLTRSPGEPSPWRELTVNLTWLLGAAIAAQSLANLGPLAVRLLGTGHDLAMTGHFMSGLAVARIPLFAFAAVQAVLLPSLVRQLVKGRYSAFRKHLLVVAAVTTALGMAGVLGVAWIGPEVLGLLFGPGFDLPRSVLVWLAVSTAVYMIALVLQPAVIALGGLRANAMAWTAGLLTFGVFLATPWELLLRIAVALTAGGVVTISLLAGVTRGGARQVAQLGIVHDPASSRRAAE